MSKNFAAVREFNVFANGRLFVAPTGTHDLVAVEGSVLGGPNMLPQEQDVLPTLAAALLDAGTATKKKSEIQDALAGRGISLSFGASDDRTFFSGRCFPEDLTVLLATIVECLGQAAFPDSEVKNVKALALGELTEAESDTRAQAERAFAALIYDPSHVNYTRPLKAEEASIVATHRADLQNFKGTLGTGGLVLSIAGDVEVASTRTLVERTFGKLGKGALAAPIKKFNTKTPTANEKHIFIADKASVDVLLGAALPLTLEHELYHPMRVLVEMLGGGAFTSHLMATIRERDGLTYGVYAKLLGLDAGADGYLKIWASFSPDRYAESVAKLRAEIDVFFTKGITAKALTPTQDRMTGSYLVSLATTQSLASALHSLGIIGRPLSYLTAYPDIIRAVTLADLKKAAALIPLDKLSLAASGTIPKK